MKGKLKQTKGITLIALIITIIVLLILAVVSIRLVVNNGILGKAESATQKYSEEETAEQEKLLKAEYEMAKYEGKFSGSYDSYTVWKQYGVKIGDYVAYDATKDENGNTITEDKATYTSYSASTASSDKNEGRSSGYISDQVFNLYKSDGTANYTGGWRVLGIENGQLQLIAADILKTFPKASGKYSLNGQKGYTDGPAELNAISAIFGHGKGATGARSVNVDDINKITGYKPEETGDGKPFASGYINEYNNKVAYYWDGTDRPYYECGEGESKKSGNLTHTHNTFNWYDGENWQSSTKSTTATTSAMERITEITSNYYIYYPTTLTSRKDGDIKGIAKTSDEWKLLFENTDYNGGKGYWLASSCIICFPQDVRYNVRLVSYERVEGKEAGYNFHYLFCSDGSNSWRSPDEFGVRPVVSLKSDIQIEKTEVNDGSTLAKACIIK